ncbi:MAG TPA: hypothetical protein VF494_04025 [Candidatus Limnocylindrales bacterium]
MKRLLLAAAATAALSLAAVAPVAAAGSPTCSDTLGIEVHGQHIVGMYVVDMNQLYLPYWPPVGGVGQYIAGEGASLPGGPGPGFHFPNGFAPGASFCTDSNSPGLHL